MDIRDVEWLIDRVDQLSNQVAELEGFVGASPLVNPQGAILVIADQDILPNEVGNAGVLRRSSESVYGTLSLRRTDMVLQVYNHRKTPIWEGEEFHVAIDTYGDYYRIRDRSHYTSFFLTPDTGLPAAPSKFHPYLATPCERHYFDFRAKEIKPLTKEQTGEPLFEPVYNHTQNEVGGDLIIQAKKIDGHWFIDVEPCPAEEG